MGTETELKLSLAAEDIPRLIQHPLLATAPRRLKLHNTYFDTAELALTQKKVAVRERRVLRKTLLTVKTAHRSEGGISHRSEWEAPTTSGSFDFSTLIDDAELAESLSQIAPQLVPIFTTDFGRRFWTLDFRRAKIEVALDLGTVSVQRDDLTREQPICELELELKEGNPTTLFALARLLSRQVRLHPAEWYVKLGAEVNFDTVAAAACHRDESAMGYRMSRLDTSDDAMHGVRINPTRKQTVVFEPGDMIVVLTED